MYILITYVNITNNGQKDKNRKQKQANKEAQKPLDTNMMIQSFL